MYRADIDIYLYRDIWPKFCKEVYIQRKDIVETLVIYFDSLRIFYVLIVTKSVKTYTVCD